MGKLRIGLVGCGPWGTYILRDLRVLGCEVHVVARSEQNQIRAREGGALTIVASAENLPDIDGIVIATPAVTHFEIAMTVAGRNVPIFVEKPIATRAGDARALVEAMPDRLFVMDKWRYHPGVLVLRDIARSGELGPVVGLRSVRVQWGHRHWDTDVVLHLAPHDLAIALEILGEIPAPRCAVADRVGDEFFSLWAVMGNAPWFQFEISSRAPKVKREVQLICRDGSATLSDSYDAHLNIFRLNGRDAPIEERRPISSEMPLLGELTAFVEHLRGGPPPRSSASEGTAVVEAIEVLRNMAA